MTLFKQTAVRLGWAILQIYVRGKFSRFCWDYLGLLKYLKIIKLLPPCRSEHRAPGLVVLEGSKKEAMVEYSTGEALQ